MKKETRKEEIVKIAASLFKEKGYSAVTMRDIAAAMGIKAASLYNHINSKQELLKDIIISLAEKFTSGIETIKDSELNSLEKMEQIVALHIELASNSNEAMASLNNDWMHLEDKLEYYLKLRSQYEDDVRLILKEGIRNNEIIDVDIDVMLFSILSTLKSLYLWIPKKEDLLPKTLAANLSKVLINGINK